MDSVKKPVNQLENRILAVVHKFLASLEKERALRGVTINSNLTRDLGIDSLGRVELFHQVEEEFGVYLPDNMLVEAETIKELLSAIENADYQRELVTETYHEPLSQTEYDPSSAKTLIEVLIKRAQAEPDRPHVTMQDESGNESIITYGDLLKSASKIASSLHKKGLKDKQTVAIMLPTCADFLYSFFGVLLAGGIPVPIYPPFRPDKIEEYAIREATILKNAEVQILITFDRAEKLSELLRVFITSLKYVTTPADLIQNHEKVPSQSSNPHSPALIQYTSGSTSDPKGVLLSHFNLLSNIRAFGKVIDLSSNDVGVSWLPLYHDMGLIGCWLASLYYAFPLVIMSPITFLTRPERWLWTIHYHRATLTAAPNFAYELCTSRIDDKAIEGLDLSSLRYTFNGAEEISPRTLERFTNKFESYGYNPKAMSPVYGLAESSVGLVLPPPGRGPKIDRINREAFEREHKAIPVTSSEKYLEFVATGSAMPGHYVKIADEKGQELPDREIGLILFKGPSSMVGYYRKPQETKDVTIDGWINSGDLGYQAEGDLYITGRKKDIIIKAGRNFYPKEIEEITSQVNGVRKGCIIAFGISDKKRGTEKLVIVAETRLTNKQELLDITAEINENVTIVLGVPPDDIVLAPPKTIPKTSSGKLQRSQCKQLYIKGKLTSKKLSFKLQMVRLFARGIVLRSLTLMGKVGKILYTSYVAILAVITSVILMSLILVLPRKPFAKFTRLWAKVISTIIFMPIKVTGSENLDENSAVIYTANHASYIDVVILLAVLPSNTVYVAKKGVLKAPILRSVIKKLKYLTVDRVDFAKNLEDTQKIIDTLKNKNSIGIFPEGTFTYATGLRAFKIGAFKVAAETLTPICPISISGARDILRGDNLLLSPGKINVTIGKKIVPQSSEWDQVTMLHSKARKFIAENCGEPEIDF